MNGPRVSVVIPAYNAGRFVNATIASVLAQSHASLEVLVVDDGSTDDTAAVVEAIARRDQRVRLLKQPNSGVSAARNRGAAESKGEFLAFLDADDLWLPRTLESILSGFSDEPSLGLVHCDFQLFDSDSGRVHPEIHAADEGRILDRLLLGCGSGRSLIAIGSFLMRAETFKAVGGFDGDLSNCADLEFYFRVASQYAVARVPQIGLHYRMLENSMHSSVALLEKDTLTAFAKATRYGFFKGPLFRRKCYSNMYLMLAGSWWKNGDDKARAAKFILLALLAFPPNLMKLLKKAAAL